MKSKPKISEYFHFTLKDRVAAIIIAIILLTAFLLPSYLEHQEAARPPATADTAWMAALRQLQTTAPVREKRHYEEKNWKKGDGMYARDRAADKYNNGGEAELFSFDPNTLDLAGWKKLGLKEKTIGTILKYVSKGGKFREPADLQRIYGLSPGKYEQLLPYISIAGKPAVANSIPPSGKLSPGKPTRALLDINTADSAAFEQLPGIGPALTMRILRFREKLGGFHSVIQIKETYGLTDSTFETIKPYLSVSAESPVRRININTASIDVLKAHPYIGHTIARVIVNYRNEHGPYSKIDDVKKISIIDVTTYLKMKPYITAD